MISGWRSVPGMVGLGLVAAVFALLFLPSGNLTHDASSYGVGRDGYRLGFELLEGLGYDVLRFNHGVEVLPDGATLWVLEPGTSLLDEGPAGMGGLAEWVARGNTLLLGVGGADDADWLRRRVLSDIEARRSSKSDGDEGRQPGVEDGETDFPPPTGASPEELLDPRGTIYEALAALGVGDVRVSGSRTPMEVGFDDPMAVDTSLDGVGHLRAVRHAPYLSGEDLSAGEIVVRAAQGPLVWRRSLGAGSVVLVADGRILCNWALAGADNAYLIASLAHLTAGDRPILVEEFSHGYAAVTALTQLLVQPPALFITVQVALVLAAVVAWRSRRFGPPRPAPRRDRRFKAEHVHALADLHRRGKHHAGAASRLRAQLLGRWRERFGGGRVMSDEVLFAWLARRTGGDPAALAREAAAPERVDGRKLLEYARRMELLRRRIEEGR